MNKVQFNSGSKIDKLLKSFIALRAIADIAPLGGLTGDLASAHDVIFSIFLNNTRAVGWSEYEALTFCAQYLDHGKLVYPYKEATK